MELLERVAPHDQVDTSHPLLQLHWIDVSGQPLTPDDPRTADEALADLLYDRWRDLYQASISYLQDRHPGTTIDPWDAIISEKLKLEARGLSQGRLDLYEKRLRAFLATEPSDDDLVQWLADRAITDAGVWARMDGADIRLQARKDFYAANPDIRDQRHRIDPSIAAEPKCEAIAGRVYDSYAEAEDALGSVWHKNCIHYVERV